jgi:hypothetical protein
VLLRLRSCVWSTDGILEPDLTPDRPTGRQPAVSALEGAFPANELILCPASFSGRNNWGIRNSSPSTPLPWTATPSRFFFLYAQILRTDLVLSRQSLLFQVAVGLKWISPERIRRLETTTKQMRDSIGFSFARVYCKGWASGGAGQRDVGAVRAHCSSHKNDFVVILLYSNGRADERMGHSLPPGHDIIKPTQFFCSSKKEDRP